MDDETYPDAMKGVLKDRQSVYGPPAVNFARLAHVWTGLLSSKLTEPITAEEVAIMSAAGKLCRLMQSPGHIDSQNDVWGYVLCLRQITEMLTTEVTKLSPEVRSALGQWKQSVAAVTSTTRSASDGKSRPKVPTNEIGI